MELPVGASTRTKASPPLTWSGRLESTSMSTWFACAAGGTASAAAVMSAAQVLLRIGASSS